MLSHTTVVKKMLWNLECDRLVEYSNIYCTDKELTFEEEIHKLNEADSKFEVSLSTIKSYANQHNITDEEFAKILREVMR